MKKILITGFDPFGGSAVNPSQLAVEQLPDAIGGFELRKRIVPTVYGLGAEMAIADAVEFCPDVILCIGVAEGRDAVTPERIAVNIQDARIPDNQGNQPTGQQVVDNAPAAYFATIPLDKMVQAIQARDIPARISNTAGTFVCNDLFYALSHRYAGTATRVGFIHVPGLDTLSLDKITEALTCAIAACQ